MKPYDSLLILTKPEHCCLCRLGDICLGADANDTPPLRFTFLVSFGDRRLNAIVAFTFLEMNLQTDLTGLHVSYVSVFNFFIKPEVEFFSKNTCQGTEGIISANSLYCRYCN